MLIQFPESYGGLKAKAGDYIREVLTKYVALMKSDRYRDKPYVLQQDGLTIHTSSDALSFLEGHGMDHLKKGQWPPYSPDLSPIENIWNLLMWKMSFYRKKPGLSVDEKKK